MTSSDLPAASGTSSRTHVEAIEPSLTEVGAKSIELYQNHLSLTDRIWAYFSTYSAMLVLMAAVLAGARKQTFVSGLTWRLLIPTVLYVFLAIGNHIALRLTLDELHQIRGVANSYTPYHFKGAPKGSMLLFHSAMGAVVLLLYLGACALAW